MHLKIITLSMLGVVAVEGSIAQQQPLTVRTAGTGSTDIFIELHLDEEVSLTGFALRLHFDSANLTWDALEYVLGTSLMGHQVLTDDTDFDGDPTTDSYLNVGWSDSSGSWPGSGTSHLLLRAKFLRPSPTQTVLRITTPEMPPGYSLDASSFLIPEDLD